MTDAGNNIDPVALVGALAPPDGWNERVDRRLDLTAASIYERVINNNVVPFRAPRRRLRVVGGLVVAVAVSGVAVAAALWDRSPDEARFVSCWSEAVSPPATQIAVAWDGTADPVSGCTRAWTDGLLGTPDPSEELTPCVITDGSVVVIPGIGNNCDALGFASYRAVADDPLVSPEDSEVLDIAAATAAISEHINPRTCLGSREALEVVQNVLDDYGFVGWEAAIEGTESALEPCATVALDESRNMAVIVFVPRAD